ncbi:MAG: hypothetical protein ACE5IG_07610 [Dehalococcoidia bacterium]
MTSESLAAEAPTLEAKFAIDPERARELNRSLEVLLLSRRCPSCRTRLEGQIDLPPAKEQLKEIEECCAKAEDFIRPEMPLLEIVFRTLLAEGNHPMTVAELHEVLTERWSTPTNPRNITPEALWRILSHEDYYCLRELP